MCGRFTLISPASKIGELLSLAEIGAFPPRYNIAPTQPILVAMADGERHGGNESGRRALLARWGLIPAWAKDPRELPLLFNARSETAAEKAAFRGAMRYRRCLVPADGFYEWQVQGKRRQPFLLRPRSREPFCFAGLMETYLAADGSEIDTAAILTTAANETLLPIHQRMPVVVPQGAYQRWLDCRGYAPAEVADLMASAPEDFFEAIPISDKVNSVANVSPDLQDPVPLAPQAANTAPAPSQLDLF
ncbi:SOS response-associated peptidase [Mangrovicella endophytica]|uniref:SOS response-associated peptidase n=1 Tax=Mangrovicella endophytica TaxID=2066697 RepID=UPI000C9E2F14|nr:SOS response-associated peptidase [Mangrovicella endophytica]